MNLKEPFVITVSREAGSGGHTVGAILAEKLGTRYLDNYLIKALEEKFKLTVSGIEKLKGEKKNWFADFAEFITPIPSARALNINSRYTQEFRPGVSTAEIFKAESEILKGLAEEGSCVIAGRSGFFVLKDHPNHLKVFITAGKEYRTDRIMRKQGLSRNEAEALIDDLDAKRENYIKKYTGKSRSDLRNYDLVLKADGHNEESLAGLILDYIGK